VTPAAIMHHFLTDEQYNEVASLFTSVYVDSLSSEERNRAFSEALKKVKLSSLEAEIEQTTDAVKLMELMKKKQEIR
jgi:DNA primase